MPESAIRAVRCPRQPGAVRAEPLGVLCGCAARNQQLLTRLIWPVQAGFPSPAEDDQDAAIDLNELLAPRR